MYRPSVVWPQAAGRPDDRLKPLLDGLQTTALEIVLRDAVFRKVPDDFVRPNKLIVGHRGVSSLASTFIVWQEMAGCEAPVPSAGNNLETRRLIAWFDVDGPLGVSLSNPRGSSVWVCRFAGP